MRAIKLLDDYVMEDDYLNAALIVADLAQTGEFKLVADYLCKTFEVECLDDLYKHGDASVLVHTLKLNYVEKADVENYESPLCE